MKFRSQLAEQASGSSGNLTASKNAFGNYLRARKAPKNPRTVDQTAVRASFTAISQAYRGLTPAQRLGWAGLGKQMTTTDALGISFTLSAAQAHSSVNGVRAAVGDDPLTDAPGQMDVIPPLPTITLEAVRTGGAGGAFVLTVQSDAYAGTVVLAASPAVSAGINYFSASSVRQIGTVTALTAGATAITTDYVAKYGTPAAGTKICVKLTPVSANGFKGAHYFATAIVGVTA